MLNWRKFFSTLTTHLSLDSGKSITSGCTSTHAAKTWFRVAVKPPGSAYNKSVQKWTIAREFDKYDDPKWIALPYFWMSAFCLDCSVLSTEKTTTQLQFMSVTLFMVYNVEIPFAELGDWEFPLFVFLMFFTLYRRTKYTVGNYPPDIKFLFMWSDPTPESIFACLQHFTQIPSCT